MFAILLEIITFLLGSFLLTLLHAALSASERENYCFIKSLCKGVKSNNNPMIDIGC